MTDINPPKTPSAQLHWLADMAEWMKQHSPAEVAAQVAQMTPEERVLFLAHVSVLRSRLQELHDNLPAE